jgi:3-oxoacyl-(acyl-carrier-protein) synthase
MIHCINSHATSTPAGDLSEAHCLKSMLGNKKIWNSFDELKNCDPKQILGSDDIDYKYLENVIITAQKGNIGHTFCAAGSLESIFAIKSL